jgi:hypothetical protein
VFPGRRRPIFCVTSRKRCACQPPSVMRDGTPGRKKTVYHPYRSSPICTDRPNYVSDRRPNRDLRSKYRLTTRREWAAGHAPCTGTASIPKASSSPSASRNSGGERGGTRCALRRTFDGSEARTQPTPVGWTRPSNASQSVAAAGGDLPLPRPPVHSRRVSRRHRPPMCTPSAAHPDPAGA